MKFTLQRENDMEMDMEYQKRYQNIGYFYQLPDAFILIYKPGNDDKYWKNVDYPILKQWIETKTMKKQDWIMLVQFDIIKAIDYNEKKLKKIFEKIVNQFTKDQQLKIFKFIQNKDPNIDIPAPLKQEDSLCQKQIAKQLIRSLQTNLDEKINFYESQILYQQMKAKNSPQDYYSYLSLMFGKVYLLVRIGQLRTAFEILQSISDVLGDNQRLFIEYDINKDIKKLLVDDVISGVRHLTQKFNLWDWNQYQVIEHIQTSQKVSQIQVFYCYFWTVYVMFQKITVKPQEILMDSEINISKEKEQSIKEALLIDKSCSVEDYLILEYDKLFQQTSQFGERLRQAIQIRRSQFKDLGQSIQIKDYYNWPQIGLNLIKKLDYNSGKQNSNQKFICLVNRLLIDQRNFSDNHEKLVKFYSESKEKIIADQVLEFSLQKLRHLVNKCDYLQIQSNNKSGEQYGDISISIDGLPILLMLKTPQGQFLDSNQKNQPLQVTANIELDFDNQNYLMLNCQNTIRLNVQGQLNNVQQIRLSFPFKQSPASIQILEFELRSLKEQDKNISQLKEFYQIQQSTINFKHDDFHITDKTQLIILFDLRTLKDFESLRPFINTKQQLKLSIDILHGNDKATSLNETSSLQPQSLSLNKNQSEQSSGPPINKMEKYHKSFKLYVIDAFDIQLLHNNKVCIIKNLSFQKFMAENVKIISEKDVVEEHKIDLNNHDKTLAKILEHRFLLKQKLEKNQNLRVEVQLLEIRNKRQINYQKIIQKSSELMLKPQLKTTKEEKFVVKYKITEAENLNAMYRKILISYSILNEKNFDSAEFNQDQVNLPNLVILDQHKKKFTDNQFEIVCLISNQFDLSLLSLGDIPRPVLFVSDLKEAFEESHYYLERII
ncbi:UNKNOWN [Stylonychia lemnae]|uniref:Uncharacterized protein n=1 Tax=Stylonychia lemnae TaxID=5949 RepID=A0A078B020_STYLE|nr:UNKNOWN [Stylonychia lemnae]|eukprot:CDW87849.1 UNKNOWN [Stylonychia lemnae]